MGGAAPHPMEWVLLAVALAVFLALLSCACCAARVDWTNITPTSTEKPDPSHAFDSEQLWAFHLQTLIRPGATYCGVMAIQQSAHGFRKWKFQRAWIRLGKGSWRILPTEAKDVNSVAETMLQVTGQRESWKLLKLKFPGGLLSPTGVHFHDHTEYLQELPAGQMPPSLDLNNIVFLTKYGSLWSESITVHPRLGHVSMLVSLCDMMSQHQLKCVLGQVMAKVWSGPPQLTGLIWQYALDFPRSDPENPKSLVLSTEDSAARLIFKDLEAEACFNFAVLRDEDTWPRMYPATYPTCQCTQTYLFKQCQALKPLLSSDYYKEWEMGACRPHTPMGACRPHTPCSPITMV